MSFRDTLTTALTALVLTPALFIFFATAPFGVAQVMQSTNYRIQSDSVNFGGGLATSTNYNLESTLGEVATGELSGNTFNIKAGYQQMVTTFLSMTAPQNVTMTPSIPGVTGGTANGSTTVTVTTDSPAGYQLTIEAAASPAMTKGSDFIADYVPLGNPDFNFNLDPTDAHFGYSPSGVNVVTRFKDDGASCNDNTQETPLACWDGLDTIAEPIARSSGANTPNGATTTVYFRVGVGGLVTQTGGVYTATTTLTAISL